MNFVDFSKGIFLRGDIHKIPVGFAEVSHNNDSSQISLVPIKGTTKLYNEEGTVGVYSECTGSILTGSDDYYWAETCCSTYRSYSDGMVSECSCNKDDSVVNGIPSPNNPITTTYVAGSDTSFTVEEARPLASKINEVKSLMNETKETMTSSQFMEVVRTTHPTVTYTDKEIELFVYRQTLVDAVGLSKTETPSNLHGTYSYVYTYYDADRDLESEPSDFTEDIIADNGSILLEGFIPPTTSNVTHYRVYRLGGLSNRYTLVHEVPIATSSILDDIIDKDAAMGKVLSTVNNSTPIKGLKHLTYRKARLFASKGNTLYFSDLGDLDSWNCYNTFNFMEDITGIGTDSNILLVFTANNTFMVSGNNPKDFMITRVSSEYGCINHRTIKLFKGAITWVSKRGINSFTSNVISLTQEMLGNIEIKESINAEVFNDMYHVSLNSTQGWQTLVLDYRHGTTIRTISPTGFFIRTPDELLMLDKGGLYSMYTGDILPLEYSTGILGEGGSSMLKNYKSMYISYEAEEDSYLRIEADTTRGMIVLNDYTLTTNANHVDYRFKDSIDVYGLQITIKGRVKVHEIALTPSIRKAR